MKQPLFRLVPYRILPRVNWLLIATTIALAGFGIVTLWGATSAGDGPGPFTGYARKQAVWLLAGVGLMAALIVFDYRKLRAVVWPLYIVVVVLLAGVLVKGHMIKGAQSWYDLGPFNLQPSEPGKIIIVLVLAHYLASRMDRFRGLHHTFIPLAIVGLPMGLILLQPDLGSSVVFVPIAGAMFWVAGLRKWVVVLFALLGVAAVVVTVPHLKPYQRDRLLVFLHPEDDPLGAGYNMAQAKTALGSGQLMGKGWGRGTQTNFRFLPEFHTDFIFPTVGEQFGMVGACLALALMLLQIGLIAHVAQQTQDLFGVLIATGMAAMLATHVVFNIGMAIGLMPVTGLPLPFFSYGGSFMLTCMTAVGLVVGIGARREL
ncbi:MAG: rod shape-determining protein RodA [Candidatus Sumerlaeia bacterium]